MPELEDWEADDDDVSFVVERNGARWYAHIVRSNNAQSECDSLQEVFEALARHAPDVGREGEAANYAHFFAPGIARASRSHHFILSITPESEDLEHAELVISIDDAEVVALDFPTYGIGLKALAIAAQRLGV